MVPCRTQQDCVLDQKMEHKSELLAVTSSLECHWYSVYEDEGTHLKSSSDGGVEVKQDDSEIALRIEKLAVLKKTDLCAKLRKLDFRKLLGKGLSLNILSTTLIPNKS